MHSLAELRSGLARYFEFYNIRRRHSALDRCTPDAVRFGSATYKLMACGAGSNLHIVSVQEGLIREDSKIPTAQEALTIM